MKDGYRNKTFQIVVESEKILLTGPTYRSMDNRSAVIFSALDLQAVKLLLYLLK